MAASTSSPYKSTMARRDDVVQQMIKNYKTLNDKWYKNKMPDSTKLLTRILDKCKKERVSGELLTSKGQVATKRDVIDRVAFYTGMARETIFFLMKKSLKFQVETIEDVESFNRVIRSKLTAITLSGKLPTTHALFTALKGKIPPYWSSDTLRMRLSNIGYVWIPAPGSRSNLRYIIENPDITSENYNFLTKITSYREAGRLIYYIDSNFFDGFGNYMPISMYKDYYCLANMEKILTTLVIYAVSKNGIVHTKFCHYNEYGTLGNFKWIVNTLLPDLPPSSVVVYNRSLHKPTSLTRPSQSSLKTEIVAYIEKCDIPYDPSMRKIELLQLIEKASDPPKDHDIDAILESFGHEVLHLPDTLQSLTPAHLISQEVQKQKQLMITKGFVAKVFEFCSKCCEELEEITAICAARRLRNEFEMDKRLEELHLNEREFDESADSDSDFDNNEMTYSTSY